MDWVRHLEMVAQALTQSVAVVIDLVAMLIVTYAAFYAFLSFLPDMLHGRRLQGVQTVRYYLGRSLVLALEFLIGADILRTSIAPSWTNIGQLGAIIILRTILDYLLEREIGGLAQPEQGKPADNSPDV